MKLYIRGYYSSCMKNVRFTFRHAILKKKKKIIIKNQARIHA